MASYENENLDEVLYFSEKSLPIDYNIKYGKVVEYGFFHKTKILITQGNL
jgi:hypothetical protein